VRVSDLAHRVHLATAADLALLPDPVRAEVIRGVIVQKAAPSYEHGDAQSSLAEILKPPFQRGHGGPGGWWIATEVEIELETHEVYLPDIVGWRRDRVPERPRGRPVRIRPDWIAEVLSMSNAENDLGTKLFSYHRAGVPHYWIIDPEHETLTVYRWVHEGYVVHLSASKGERVKAAPFEDVEIDVALLFGG
jgi:Uma2 family endonuclease